MKQNAKAVAIGATSTLPGRIKNCQVLQKWLNSCFPPTNWSSMRHSSYTIYLYIYSLYIFNTNPFSNCYCPSDMVDSARTVAKVAGLSSEQDVRRAVLALHENMPRARQPTATCLLSWVSPRCHPPNGSWTRKTSDGFHWSPECSEEKSQIHGGEAANDPLAKSQVQVTLVTPDQAQRS